MCVQICNCQLVSIAIIVFKNQKANGVGKKEARMKRQWDDSDKNASSLASFFISRDLHS